jgi:hypothetical protein
MARHGHAGAEPERLRCLGNTGCNLDQWRRIRTPAFDPRLTSQRCAGQVFADKVFADALDFRRPRHEPETAPQEEAS